MNKKLLIAALIMVVGLTILVNTIVAEIHEAGGVRQMVVDRGKEIKSIIKDINNE